MARPKDCHIAKRTFCIGAPYGQTKIIVAVVGDEVPNSSLWNNLSCIHGSHLLEALKAGHGNYRYPRRVDEDLTLICRCASQGIASSGGRACEEPGPSSFAPLAIGLLPASMSGDNSPRLG
jgi:hypothetical protein